LDHCASQAYVGSPLCFRRLQAPGSFLALRVGAPAARRGARRPLLRRGQLSPRDDRRRRVLPCTWARRTHFSASGHPGWLHAVLLGDSP